jgi:hypothetical protein
MTSKRLSLDQIKELIGQPGHRVRLFTDLSFDPVVVSGEIIGLAEHPTIIVRLEDGTQGHYPASMRIAIVPPDFPEPDNLTVWLYTLEDYQSVWRRDDRRAQPNRDAEIPLERWFGTGQDKPQRWASLARLQGTWVQLHPAAASPVVLAVDPSTTTVEVFRPKSGGPSGCPSCWSYQRIRSRDCINPWHLGGSSV